MEITNEQEFRVTYDNFYLAYNRSHDIWYARHEDEQSHEDDIIVDVEQLKEEPIELFDGFLLDIQEFKEIEQLKNTFF